MEASDRNLPGFAGFFENGGIQDCEIEEHNLHYLFKAVCPDLTAIAKVQGVEDQHPSRCVDCNCGAENDVVTSRHGWVMRRTGLDVLANQALY
jgi:hypothetical protein